MCIHINNFHYYPKITCLLKSNLFHENIRINSWRTFLPGKSNKTHASQLNDKFLSIPLQKAKIKKIMRTYFIQGNQHKFALHCGPISKMFNLIALFSVYIFLGT